MLVESTALRFGFVMSEKYVSVEISFGDSYAFGMAGTGGTSPSSSPCELLFVTLGCRATDNRGVADGWRRCWTEPVEVLTVLRLAVEPMERPELYDLRWLTSGVVRAEDGVKEVLRGIMEGERDSARVSRETGGGGGGTLLSTLRLCDWGRTDNRFILLVSVGLIVRAPKPVT